jgi:hypothetical protein
LNADDTNQPGAIKTAVNNMLATSEVNLIYSDIQIIDEQNRKGQIWRSQPFSFKTYFESSYIRQPTVFMRKWVIEILGGVNEHLHWTISGRFTVCVCWKGGERKWENHTAYFQIPQKWNTLITS